jgi:hypothetical protein
MFSKSVFINCPFDDDYFTLLRPLLFTVIFVGYKPRLALECSDSGETRIEKLTKIISESKYSIHDLSRIQAQEKDDFYRMNMPFEIGMDFGCRKYSTGKQKKKKYLILEKEKYRYVRALSDIAGFDIKNHNNDPMKMVEVVRDWAVETIGISASTGPTGIWNRYNDFMYDLYIDRKADGFSDDDLEIMPIKELINYMEEWK